VITASSVCDRRRPSDIVAPVRCASDSTGSTVSGTRPRPRSIWRAARAESASSTPLDSLPAVSAAAYLKAAMRRRQFACTRRFASPVHAN
jgi:hypothetical protein